MASYERNRARGKPIARHPGVRAGKLRNRRAERSSRLCRMHFVACCPAGAIRVAARPAAIETAIHLRSSAGGGTRCTQAAGTREKTPTH
jgi:hypothetical protein